VVRDPLTCAVAASNLPRHAPLIASNKIAFVRAVVGRGWGPTLSKLVAEACLPGGYPRHTKRDSEKTGDS
jgi:hypothetical protein